jgi:hypothetical protein
MKLLLVVPNEALVHGLVAHFNSEFTPNAEHKFLLHAKWLHHEVDVIVALGFSTSLTYQLTKALGRQKYHLALKISLAAAYSATTVADTILNIVNEKPADVGEQTIDGWQDVYDLNWLNREDAPHVRGGFVNMTNAYMNVFMPFKKVVGLTVNHQADTSLVVYRKERYKAEVETADGLAFVYACLAEQQTYYHLAVVNRNLTDEVNQNNTESVVLHLLTDLIEIL